jgi:uncharacterized phage-like protein YoqJ
MIIDGVVATFQREYKDGLVFNLGGCIGADQWVGRACMELGVEFNLYLPMLPELQSRYWTQTGKDELTAQLNATSSVDIVDSSGLYNIASYHERDKKMVDNADILVAFWVGKRKGGTFFTMKYALKNSKFVFNALDSLRPVFKEDLKKGWTPKIEVVNE